MPNKTTVAITRHQYYEYIDAMMKGGAGFRANRPIATALMLEANLGMRISDILALTPSCIVQDGNRYRLDLKEIKTSKYRSFKVPEPVYKFIMEYCKDYNITKTEKLFKIKERNVQQYLQKVTDYLGYSSQAISTHSFRKMFGREIYEDNDHDIVLVQQIYQHSSPEITMKYLALQSERIDAALDKNILL